jgi:tRNA(Ile)-lysidine synthase
MVRPGGGLLVGVSGGPDSVALLHILRTLQKDLEIDRLTVAHFNHRLRGVESLGDHRFVENLAAELGVECRSGSEDVRVVAGEMRLSLEMAARICRHRFFQSVASSLGGTPALALAHNANDQAEEVLMRLCRGTGPSGLGGMRPREGSGIVRPLLFATRTEILNYLNALELPYRLDSSNQDPSCQRNRVRLEVLPLLEDILHPGIVRCIERHARLARDEEEYWDATLASLWPKVCVVELTNEIRLHGLELLGLHPALLRRALRRAVERLQGHTLGLFADHVEKICLLLRSGSSGKRIHLPADLRAELQAGDLVLMTGGRAGGRVLLPEEPLLIERTGSWSWGKLMLKLQLMAREDLTLPQDFRGAGRNRAFLDADGIQWPLCVRRWRHGDRFQPLGLSGHKKLQDFFVDLKIPRGSRGNIPILCDREKICWIVGYRLDERAKVTLRTRQVLFVEVLSSGPLG